MINILHIKILDEEKINWASSEKKIHLNEHEYLIWQLIKCVNFFDIYYQPYTFPEKDAELWVDFEFAKDFINCSIKLIVNNEEADTPFNFVSEDYGNVGNIIYE